MTEEKLKPAPEFLNLKIRVTENGFLASIVVENSGYRTMGNMEAEYVAMTPEALSATITAEFEKRLGSMIARLSGQSK